MSGPAERIRVAAEMEAAYLFELGVPKVDRRLQGRSCATCRSSLAEARGPLCW